MMGLRVGLVTEVENDWQQVASSGSALLIATFSGFFIFLRCMSVQ